METLLDVIGAMQKATAREVAARMKIDVREALDMLREHELSGEVSQVNGIWQLPVLGKSIPSAGTASTTDTSSPTVSASDLISIIAEHGRQTAEGLAKLTGVTARKITSTLAIPTNRGRVVRENDGGKFYYCLPQVTDQPSEIAEPLPPVPEFNELPPIEITKKASTEKQVSADEFLESLPVFIKPQPLQVPTLREISKEIRRTKGRLSQLEKCRGALRVLQNYKTMLVMLGADKTLNQEQNQ